MSIQEKIISKLQSRLDEKLGYRADLYIADYRKVTSAAAQVLLGYEKSIGTVSTGDITNFFIKTFNGKVIPKLETAKVHTEDGAISLVAECFTPTRKLVDAKTMTCIASTRFIDADLGETWEVKGEGENKFLARVSDENIAAILQERKNRMAVKSSKLTLASLCSDGMSADISGSIANLNVGDVVKYYFDAHIEEGEVVGLLDTGVKIKNLSGNVVTVPREAVMEVKEVSPEAEQAKKEKMHEYFKDAYGFELYADELVKK